MVLFKRFWQISRLYWLSEEKWGAIALLSILVLSNLLSTHLLIIANTQRGELLSNLAAKDTIRFWITAKYLFGVYLLLPLNWGGYNYIRKKLSIYWRRWLTKYFLNKYFQNRTFYQLTQSHKEIDNPDQRIAEDINKFADGFLSFFFNLLFTCFQVVAFSFVLWKISSTLMFVLIIYVGSGRRCIYAG